jgi:hypothetical protein
MPRIEILTTIAAPAALCFDTARDIDLHVTLAGITSENLHEVMSTSASIREPGLIKARDCFGRTA